MKKRIISLFIVVALILGYIPIQIAQATGTTQVLLATKAGTFLQDNSLSETFWAKTACIESSSAGMPSASVAAAWDSTNLYLGLATDNTTSISVTLGEETVDATPSSSGVCELAISWQNAGITIQDYNQIVTGLLITLEGNNSSYENVTLGVKITSLSANSVALNQMTKYPTNTSGISFSASQAIWNTSSAGVTKLYKTGYSFADHNKNILITQTLTIDDLPVSEGKFNNDQSAEDCYHFWLSDAQATNNTTNADGSAIFCSVYRADTTGNLYMRICNDRTIANNSAGVPLGKALGDTFDLSVLWNADNSAAVYVDGQAVYTLQNATTAKTRYMGAKCLQLLYNATAAGKHAEFTVENVVVHTSGATTVTESITQNALLGSTDLSAVTTSLELPSVYFDQTLGYIPLVWSSSDTSVISNFGAVTRPADTNSRTATLTLSVYENDLWSANVTVLPSSGTDSIAVNCADEITLDGVLNEKFYLHYQQFTPSNNSAPSGKAVSAYNKNGLYVGVQHSNAEKVIILLNGHETVVDLTSGNLSGIGYAAVSNGVAEVLLPWSSLNVAFTDYNQLVQGFQVTLTGMGGTTHLLASTEALLFTSEQINEIDLSEMSKLNGAGVTAVTNQAVWNTSASGVTGLYKTGYTIIDHNKDIFVTQTVNISNLPISEGKFTDDQSAQNCYYFWVTDAQSTDNTSNINGSAIFCSIYRADAAGNLYMRICDEKSSANNRSGIALGKTLGETFLLSINWCADDTAYVYVDNVLVCQMTNATCAKTRYMGAKCIQLRYNASATGNEAVFTISNFAISVATTNSVAEEITAARLLNGISLTGIETDVPLPATFKSDYLGDVPVSWISSNNSILDAATGDVTRPTGGNSVTVQLSAVFDETTLWTVNATILPAIVEAAGPYPASPNKITAAYVSSGITIDGKLREYSWLLNTRVLTSNYMTAGKFGVLWDSENIYLAAQVKNSATMTLTINGLTSSIDTSTLGVTGDFSVGEIAKRNTYIEVSIPLSELNITLSDYNTAVPMSVSLDGNTYSGTVKLTSIEWFAAGNEYRPLPASLKNTVKTGSDNPVSGYQGYEQTNDGWRMYDLYNANGVNPSLVRTYVIHIGDDLYEPLKERDRTTYIEFDFLAHSLPIYEITPTISLSTNFASYGMTWFAADEINESRNANTLSMGIFNTERGLVFAALPSSGVPTVYFLNKSVGDLFRVGTAWKTNGDVILYIDGQQFATIAGLECPRKSFGNKCVAFNLIRNETPALSNSDNMDVSISNVAMGHSYDDHPIDTITFETIAGANESETNVVSNLTLPLTYADPILDIVHTATWTTSDPNVISITGMVTRPVSGEANVTVTVTLEDGETKAFELTVPGISNSSGDVLVVRRDYTPATGIGLETDSYQFTLDEENSSVIRDLGAITAINVVELHDGDSFARLNEEVLTLWVSDDNETYTQVEGFKLLHKESIWYLYGFSAEGRYVKVHCTHYNGKEADFSGPVATMIVAYNEAVFGAGGSPFTNLSQYILTNNSGIERFDYAWQINKLSLGINGSDASIRVFLGDDLLYHYVEGNNVYVRVPYLDDGASVILTVLSGNTDAMDIANKEYVYEVTYGTKEAWVVSDGAHWILKLNNGDILVLGGSNNMLWRAISHDGGRTWTNKANISCSSNYITEGGGFIYNSVTGRIMFHGHNVVNWNASDMSLSDCATNIIYSDDNGATWAQLGTVQSDSTYLLSYTDGIQLSCYDGTGPNVDFVFPLGAQYNNSGAFCGRVAYSADGGLTWQTSATKIIYQQAAAFECGVSECTIQERSDGVLVLLGRNQGSGTNHFAKSYSYDHGLTWQTPASLSSVYSVNTQPIMFIYNNDPMLAWGGNNILGDNSYVRTPYNIAVSEDGMETFRNIQDLYSKYSLQGLTYYSNNRITNPTVQVTDDDSFVTIWWNSTDGWATTNTVVMHVEDFYDFFYHSKGAYDSFEHGTVRYEGWETARGEATLSDEQASEGDYSMKLSTAVAARSIPYLQNGTVSMDVYVDANAEFTVELQSAFSSIYGSGAPVGFSVEDYGVTFLGAASESGLTLQNGWNNVTFGVQMDAQIPTVSISVNNSSPVVMPVNLNIGDYITFITITNIGTIYVDNMLVIDDQDAAQHEAINESVSVSANTTTLHVNSSPSSVVLSASVTNPCDDYSGLSWISSNEAVVRVTDNGNGSALASAVGNGTAVITVIANDGSGALDSITITVN